MASGRRSGGPSGQFGHGPGAFERALVAFLAWWHKTLVEPGGDFLAQASDRLWGLRRAERRLVVVAMGMLTLVIAGLVIAATIQGAERDHSIVETQSGEPGFLVEEDFAGCRLGVDLHGRMVEARTSCNTGSSFPAGTRVFVVQDPADPKHFLVAAPGQDWGVATTADIWFGILSGVAIALAIMWLGHHILLHPDRPASPREKEPPTDAAGPPRVQDGTAPTTALDRFEDSWESGKAALLGGRKEFLGKGLRPRGATFGVLVMALTAVAIALGTAMGAGYAHDRTLARTEPVVEARLLDYGAKGENPTVRFGMRAIELDYGLRGGSFLDIGDTVEVVEDPQYPGRLIPAEYARPRGVWGMVRENGPMAVAWLAGTGFLGWLLIPRELAALGRVIDPGRRGDRPGPRH